MSENKNSKEMVKTAVAALQDKKGADIRVIDISEVTVIADYFIIASGSNPNQVQALVDNVEEQMHKAGFAEPKVEGYATASWILLDYEDIIVHVFSEDDRLFYNLERIWRDGKPVEIESL
jgi:ribosome-associated protein